MDLINRQDAIDKVTKHYRIDNDLLEIIVYEIELLPSVEQEIIRCNDCRHNGSFDTDCPIRWNKTDGDFCSFAERRTDE